MGTFNEKHTILVVDDNSEIRGTLMDILEDRGYQAIGASDGKQALAQLADRSHQPCAILLDAMMPVMDGRSFRREQLKDADLARIPVVVISALNDLSQLRDLTAEAYLRKPIDIDAMMSILQQYCPVNHTS